MIKNMYILLGKVLLGKDQFIVLDGIVEMLFKENKIELSAQLQTGNIFYVSIEVEYISSP